MVLGRSWYGVGLLLALSCGDSDRVGAPDGSSASSGTTPGSATRSTTAPDDTTSNGSGVDTSDPPTSTNTGAGLESSSTGSSSTSGTSADASTSTGTSTAAASEGDSGTTITAESSTGSGSTGSGEGGPGSSESNSSASSSSASTGSTDLSTGMDGGSGDTGTTTLCGNGDLDPGEDCDDGNVVGGDGCEASCTSSDDVPPVWTLELGGVGPNYGYPDCGTGVAFDGDGNLILGAYTAPDVIWLRKYDAQYVEQWTVTYDTFGGSCFVRVATDAMGNVGFVGTVAELPSGSSLDMFFGVLDPDGNEVWTTQLAGSGIEASDAGDVAFDAEGNLLVTGTVVFSPAIYGDVWVGKYDPLGAPLWSASYDGAVAGGDRGRGVAADVDGSVLVAGNTRGAGNTQDIFAAKYDSSGAEMWTDIVAGAAGSADFGWGVAAYGEDGFFTGIVRDLPMDGNTWLRRYDMSGQPTWTELYSGTGAGNDGAVDIALPDDGTGTVLLAGAVNDIAGDRYWVARLSTDGSVIWERRRIEDGGWYAVASAPDGRVAVAGYSFYPFPLDIEARFAVYPP